MTDTVVDTNVLMDVAEEDPTWSGWSGRWIVEAANEGALVINQVVYGELAGAFDSMEVLDASLPPERFRRESLPWEAAFLAGLAFLAYRARGGPRLRPLPDFFIGAHAAVRGYRLLTRDRGYYRTYFPTLAIVSPETHP